MDVPWMFQLFLHEQPTSSICCAVNCPHYRSGDNLLEFAALSQSIDDGECRWAI